MQIRFEIAPTDSRELPNVLDLRSRTAAVALAAAYRLMVEAGLTTLRVSGVEQASIEIEAEGPVGNVARLRTRVLEGGAKLTTTTSGPELSIVLDHFEAKVGGPDGVWECFELVDELEGLGNA